MAELKSALLDALKKKAPYGPDVDLERYELGRPEVEEDASGAAAEQVRGAAERVGLSPSAAAYVQANERALFGAVQKALKKYGVEVLPLKVALEKFDLAKDLSWRIVDPATDKYTAAAYLYGGELGYFIYVPPNTKVDVPIYTCLAITKDRRIQFAHNIVYVGEGSEAHVVTGCAVPHGVFEGLHVGVSEFYVKRGARLTFSMVHAWAKGLHVRPRTAVDVEDGGEYVSYYVIYSPIASLQTYPSVRLGEGARAYLASVVFGSGAGVYDVGSKAALSGEGASAEVVSRALAVERAAIYARAELVGEAPRTKGHIECLGLLLSSEAFISSVPVISSKALDSRLSHEAAIGVIAPEELEYLVSKGFTEEEAKAILVRGFMSVEPRGLPASVKAEISKILEVVSKQAVG